MSRETWKRLLTVALLLTAAVLAVYSFRHTAAIGSGESPVAQAGLEQQALTSEQTGTSSSTGGEFLNIRLFDILGLLLLPLVALGAQRALAPRDRLPAPLFPGRERPARPAVLLVILAAAVFSLAISVGAVYDSGSAIGGGGLLAAALISYRLLAGPARLDRLYGELARRIMEILAIVCIATIGIIGLVAGAGFLDLAGGGLGTGFRQACLVIVALATTLSVGTILYATVCGLMVGWR